MSSSQVLTCPYCPESHRCFGSHGLKVHIGRIHKNVLGSYGLSSTVPAASDSQGTVGHTSQPVQSRLINLAGLRKSTTVLRHIPKGARNIAAAKLSDIINKCLETNEEDDWCSLLMFSFRCLKTPTRTGTQNLTQKVKANINTSGSFPFNDHEVAYRESRSQSIQKSIEDKVHDGDLRGAVRLLVSQDRLAPYGSETLNVLQSKHPSPSRALDFPPAPVASEPSLNVTVDEVKQVLASFYSGSAGGLDGIRPGHLKELTSSAAGDSAHRLLSSLTKLSNFLLSGQLNPTVCPYMYGASLCALSKKDGGVRPIAIGSVFRRLVAKLACRAVKEEVADYLQPHQLGFGTVRGCEAAIHATRTFVTDSENRDCIVIKLDIKNAFNSVERDVLLSEVRDKIPAVYPFLYQVYHNPSNLFYGDNLILSQVGAQQGDPLGPLAFSLALHKLISELKSPLNIWYLDDGIIGGKPEDIQNDLDFLIPRLRDLGMELSTAKCEFFPCSPDMSSSFSSFYSSLPGLKNLTPSTFHLLGSPIFPAAVPSTITAHKELLLSAQERLKLLSAHVALILLRMCFAVPKIVYLLRTAPTWLYPDELSSIDGVLRDSIESILNISLSEDQWSQASLPIRLGGLGIRRTQDISLPAFLASAHGVQDLVSEILSLNGGRISLPFVDEALLAWSNLLPEGERPEVTQCQRSWDDIAAKRVLMQLQDRSSGVDLARLKAVSEPESGAWLHAIPSPYFGTLLDNDSLRVATALRLGSKVCETHICICGAVVGESGHHGLSCRRCMGRFPRHHSLNDIVRRALSSANVPCVLEPVGLSRTDGKRPDGLTLIPWEKGKCLVWDATCVCTFASSHLARTVITPGAAAEYAAQAKRGKYSTLRANYIFIPFTVETTGCWGADAKSFVHEIGRRMREKGQDPRSEIYLRQRISLAIQRGNAAGVMGTFRSRDSH